MQGGAGKRACVGGEAGWRFSESHCWQRTSPFGIPTSNIPGLRIETWATRPFIEGQTWATRPLRIAGERESSGMSHADDRLTALKGTGFSPYIKPAKSRGL
jgi:hypothetical protein